MGSYNDDYSIWIFVAIFIIALGKLCIGISQIDKTNEVKKEETIIEENCIKDKELSKQVSELIGKEVTICE